jgi:transcriptional regulator with XRE-family HTH domain
MKMEETIYEIVGKAFRKARRSKRLSQEEVSQKLATHQSYISRVEKGHQQMSVAALEKIAKAIDMKLIITFK